MYLGLACPGFAQVNATAGGTVSDPSGAFIPMVTVTARNTSTGVTTNSVTNGTGVYEFPSLQPGTYTMSATTAGFQTETYKDVELGQGQQVRLNFNLQVAGGAQSVDVVVPPFAWHKDKAGQHESHHIHSGRVGGSPLYADDAPLIAMCTCTAYAEHWLAGKRNLVFRPALTASMLTAVLLALNIIGCGSKELTQQDAKEIIERSALYRLGKQKVTITRMGANALVALGYAAWVGIDASRQVITEAGEPFFDSVSGGAGVSRSSFTSPLTVVPKFPLNRKIVEITSIRSTSDATIVEYRWSWDSDEQPAILKQLLPELADIREDKATFRNSRDGWQVSWQNE